MLRRKIDLSIRVTAKNYYQRTFPPRFPDFEITGPERGRVVMQNTCRLEPYHLDGHPDEVYMDIIMGHSTPHTHVDVFMHDWYTMFEDIPRESRWVQRDVSQLPTQEIIGEASIIDISDVPAGSPISLGFFKSRAQHIQRGDMVFVKTGHAQRYEEAKKTGKTHLDLSVITPEIVEWLADEKKMRVYGHDAVINGNFKYWMKSEQVCYRKGVLMIDRMAHLDRVEGGTRVFANVGICLKMADVDDSPARVTVLLGLDNLAEQKAVDLYDPVLISASEVESGYPFERSEPFELKGDVMKRLRIKNFHVPMAEYDMEEDGWCGFKAFSNHVGTHIVIPSLPMAGREIPADKRWNLSCADSNKLFGSTCVVNAWAVGPRQNVTAKILEKYASHIRAGDIVVLRTGFTDDYYLREDFLTYTPGFAKDAVQWLIDKGIKMLVTDTASIEPAPYAGSPVAKENTWALFSNGIPAVLCAADMWRLQHPRSLAFVSPMALAGLNASPCRVLIIEEYK
ncbi:cyclase family protein [Breznakiella homolactica]|uniref:Cyclase family protein n=1 Tax=Breznakiella homolactica TaxID=2798577 RepID=A0A7T7XQL8_9SPIR|nr:cyclase family protein [Breznakiella homolactica]QQO10627.1 cyclase family protein [Breznakiella homolactica]